MLKDVQVDADHREVAFVFGGCVGPRAHGVAKVIEGQAGHDSIQVDDADTLPGFVVDHDVVEFGIVVGDALGQNACLQIVDQDGGIGCSLLDEADLGLHGVGAVHCVPLNRLDKGFEAFRRVVKVSDGFVELLCRKVADHPLEISKGLGRAVDLLQAAGDLVGLGALDKEGGAPILAAGRPVQDAAIHSADEGE